MGLNEPNEVCKFKRNVLHQGQGNPRAQGGIHSTGNQKHREHLSPTKALQRSQLIYLYHSLYWEGAYCIAIASWKEKDMKDRANHIGNESNCKHPHWIYKASERSYKFSGLIAVPPKTCWF